MTEADGIGEAEHRGREVAAPLGSDVAAEDYLKAIYELEPAADTVSTSEIADRLGRSAASVTSMLKRLSEHGFVDYVPYRGVRLTRSGTRRALGVLRRHRIIELYLIEELGYEWDGVHAEAERLEHAASDELVERMARVLGQPEFDPHGAPIPSSGGSIQERETRPLPQIEPGERAVVLEVEDENPETLRYLASVDLVPGREVEVCSRAPQGEALAVRVRGEIHAVARETAGKVRVRSL